MAFHGTGRRQLRILALLREGEHSRKALARRLQLTADGQRHFDANLQRLLDANLVHEEYGLLRFTPERASARPSAR